MAGKTTDRKGKKDKLAEPVESFSKFTLPDYLPSDEVDYPVLINRKVTANWKAIVDENQKFKNEVDELVQSKQEPDFMPPFKNYTLLDIASTAGNLNTTSNTETDYIKNEVLVCLIPAIEETLKKAKIWECFAREKCFFNGIDWIVQHLWNNNPRYPHRALNPLHLYNMPWVRKILQTRPRPYYPKSYLWPEDYAATLIQKTVRQYFVQREDEVQEMREFWRKLKMERTLPQIDVNPMLARKFASTRSLLRKK